MTFVMWDFSTVRLRQVFGGESEGRGSQLQWGGKCEGVVDWRIGRRGGAHHQLAANS